MFAFAFILTRLLHLLKMKQKYFSGTNLSYFAIARKLKFLYHPHYVFVFNFCVYILINDV